MNTKAQFSHCVALKLLWKRKCSGFYMWPVAAEHEDSGFCTWLSPMGINICFVVSEEPVTSSCGARLLFVLALSGDLNKQALPHLTACGAVLFVIGYSDLSFSSVANM